MLQNYFSYFYYKVMIERDSIIDIDVDMKNNF